MFYLNIFSALFILVVEFSVALTDVAYDYENEYIAKVPENKRKTFDYKERQEIAENYLNTLDRVKDNWVDPYDMIGYPVEMKRDLSSLPKKKKDDQDVPKFMDVSNQNHEPVDQNTVPDDQNIIPGDQINKPVDQNIDALNIPMSRPPDLGNDEKPIFSDIRGDVIGEKLNTDDSVMNIDVEFGGFFAKGRQQICVLDSIYISRWLKKLVMKIEKDSGSVPSTLSFPLDSVAFNNLKEISTAKSLEISQLDQLICSMIEESTVVGKEDFDWSNLTAHAKDLVWPVTVFIVVAVCGYILYKSFVHCPVLTMLCCIVVISVFWHWMHLYKQKQSQKHAELSSMTIPPQCRKNEFGVFEHIQEYVKSLFTANDCAKYYEALMVDPFWEVSLTVAASEAVTAMLFQPLSSASRAVNLALKQLFDGLSIFISVPLIVLMFLLAIMLCNYKIRLPFYIFALEPHVPPVGSSIEEVKPSIASKKIKAVIRYKLPSNMKDTHVKTPIGQGHLPVKSSNVPQNYKNIRSIQHSVQASNTHPPLKRSGSTHGCQDKNTPSKIKDIVEKSVSEDDISIIDSDENNSDSECSLNPQVSTDFQHCCLCCFEMPNMNADCKVCGDSLQMQEMGDSLAHSVKNNEAGSNIGETHAQRTTDTIQNMESLDGDEADKILPG